MGTQRLYPELVLEKIWQYDTNDRKDYRLVCQHWCQLINRSTKFIEFDVPRGESVIIRSDDHRFKPNRRNLRIIKSSRRQLDDGQLERQRYIYYYYDRILLLEYESATVNISINSPYGVGIHCPEKIILYDLLLPADVDNLLFQINLDNPVFIPSSYGTLDHKGLIYFTLFFRMGESKITRNMVSISSQDDVFSVKNTSNGRLIIRPELMMQGEMKNLSLSIVSYDIYS